MSGLCGRGWLVSVAGLVLVQVGCLGTTSQQLNSPETTVTARLNTSSKAELLEKALTLAQNLDRGDDAAAAAAQYEQVLQIDPNHLQARRRLAVLADRQGDFTRAEAEYVRLAETHTKNADVFNDWGYSHYLRTNWAEAETKLRRALEIDPKHGRAWSNLGLTLGQQDRYDEALQAFRAAGVSAADAHCNLAFVYWSRWKLDEARRECYKAREIFPGCTRASEILAELDRPPIPGSERERLRRGPRPKRERPLPELTPAVPPPLTVQNSGPAGAAQGPITLPSGQVWVPVSSAVAAGHTDSRGGEPGLISRDWE